MTSLKTALQEIKSYAETRMQEVNMPGLALAVTSRDSLLEVATFGYADIAARSPVQEGTMFEVGSIGKSFTNIALMQLYDEGRLDLNAPVSHYLPWFEVQSDHQPITTHHLMSHTSGLGSGTDIGTHGLYEAWALRDSRTGFAPGSHFRYSNVGYKLLGFLLEELDGRSYQESIQARVLDPLGMRNSHPVIGYDTRKLAAVGYRSFYDDRPEHVDHGLVPAMWTEYGVGDGCQASTAGDMATYLRMYMNGVAGPDDRVISDESFRLMTQKVIATPQWGGAHYGYGLILADIDGHAYVGHGGSTTGFVSAMIADVDEGIGVVVLINGLVQSFGAANMALHMLGVLRAGINGQEMPAYPEAPDWGAVSNAAEYEGTYTSASTSTHERFQITAVAGGLSLRWQNEDVALERYGQDSFYVPHPDLEHHLLEFGREGEQVVEVFHGPGWYVREDYSGPRHFDYPAEWDSYCGHYRTYNFGLTNFRVAVRKGRLLLLHPTGGHETLVPLGEGLFRIGEDPTGPETIRFDAVASGKALRAVYSGCPYYRTYTH